MNKDVLFLLPPEFEGNNQRAFCPGCAEIWGVLSYFPAIKEGLEVRYQPFARPRTELVARLGEEHQNCPTLVLAENSDAGPYAAVKEANGARFFDNARDIARYFAYKFGTPFPHD